MKEIKVLSMESSPVLLLIVSIILLFFFLFPGPWTVTDSIFVSVCVSALFSETRRCLSDLEFVFQGYVFQIGLGSKDD